MSTIYDIPVQLNNGIAMDLNQFKGKVIVLVNVASKCGLTPQYTALQKLYEDYASKGVVVLGLPSNDFLAQEPGTDEEVQEFCTLTYNVTFPLLKKSPVVGENKHPLIAKLIEQQPETLDREVMITKLTGYGIPTAPAPEVAWNFEKFIINKDGTKVTRHSPSTTPDDQKVIATIEEYLK